MTDNRLQTDKRTISEAESSSSWRPFFRWCLKWGFIAFVWGVSFLTIGALYMAHDLPDISKLGEIKKVRKVTIISESGEVLTNLGDLYVDYTPYDAFPRELIQAVVATEDRRFFRHIGVDPWGMLRAAFRNYQAGYVVEGGSTITQQLAKIVFLSPERTFKRKIQEMMLALALERKFTKEQILTIYLNRVYMGAGIYGVSGAAKYYFGKPVRNITLYESAMIAGLLKAPSRYSPVNNKEKADKRAHQILINMVDAGVITEKKLAEVKARPVRLETSALGSLKNPYFADWIMEQLPYYTSDTESDLVVQTTLNPAMQRAAEISVEKILGTKGEKLQASQGALVALSPDGKILAMVGGRDYDKSPFNRATKAQRQPGSSFKLFVYLAAFELGGLTPEDAKVDGPISIRKWQPRNYDGRYRGTMSLREAFAESINTVAVQISEQVGRKNVVSVAHRAGIVSPLDNLPSLALGSVEVNLLELTSGYATVANNGTAIWPYGIIYIKDSTGRLLYQHETSGLGKVLSERTVRYAKELLKEVILSGTGRAAQLDRPAAGKTGTTSDYRDALFVGFTADVVAGVWVGNDDNTPMKKVTGGNLPAQIWKDFMLQAHAGKPARDIGGGQGDGSVFDLIEKLPFVGEESDKASEAVKRHNPQDNDSFWNQIMDKLQEDKNKIEYTYPEAPRR